MSSKRTKHHCRFVGCSETFKTIEGRNYHEEQRHITWITPTIGTVKQMFDVSHICTWNNNTENQKNVFEDRLNVDSCFSGVN